MKSALFVWGGWEGHQPKQCAELFAGILTGEGYEVEVSDTLDAYLDTEKLQSLEPDRSGVYHVHHHAANRKRGCSTR